MRNCALSQKGGDFAVGETTEGAARCGAIEHGYLKVGCGKRTVGASQCAHGRTQRSTEHGALLK